jgi:hypothetical protein
MQLRVLVLTKMNIKEAFIASIVEEHSSLRQQIVRVLRGQLQEPEQHIVSTWTRSSILSPSFAIIHHPFLSKYPIIDFLTATLYLLTTNSNHHNDARPTDPLRPPPRFLRMLSHTTSKVNQEPRTRLTSVHQLYLSLYLGLVPINETFQREVIPVVRLDSTSCPVSNSPPQITSNH